LKKKRTKKTTPPSTIKKINHSGFAGISKGADRNLPPLYLVLITIHARMG
jgi:hypothetical protein